MSFDYNSKNPKMVFVRFCIVTQPTAHGRKMFFNREFKECKDGETRKIEVTNSEEYHQILKNEFNIVLPEHKLFWPMKA